MRSRKNLLNFDEAMTAMMDLERGGLKKDESVPDDLADQFEAKLRDLFHENDTVSSEQVTLAWSQVERANDLGIDGTHYDPALEKSYM